MPAAMPGAPAKENPRSQYNSTSISASASQAMRMLDRSTPNSPGMTRRAGRTIQSVSAVTNCPTGLRKGARSHCM